MRLRQPHLLITIAPSTNICFFEVRSFEAFKYLHLGMIAEIPRKSLPAIARVAGLQNEQVLHHFLTQSAWDIEALRKQRLALMSATVTRSSYPSN